MNFVKMAGTRLVPPHSLAFRPEWYPRASPPDASPSLRRDRNAAPRGCPPSGALQHAVSRETAPGGLPHQTHTLREVPRCAKQLSPRGVSVQEPPPASAHRVDGHVSVILLHLVGTSYNFLRELPTHTPGLAAPA